MLKILSRIGLRYGLMAAALSMMAFTVLHFAEQKPLINLHQMIIDGLVFALALGVAMKDFRDYYHKGVLTFGQGMTIGFSATTVFAVFFSLYVLFFITLLQPEFLTEYRQDLIAQIQNLPTEELDDDFRAEQIDKARQLTNSAILLDTMLKKFLTGLLLAPVVTVVFRRMPKE